MAIYYDFRKKPGQQPDEENPVMTPRVVSSGTCKAEELYEIVGHGTTFQPGELEGVLQALVDRMIYELRNGKTVELGKLGYFSLKLTSREVTDKNTIHAQSVSFKNMNYRPSAWMKHQFGSLRLVRSPRGFNQSKESTLEQRKRLLNHFLDNHPFITRSEYTGLTGLLKKKALEELNQLVVEGYLATYGGQNRKVYIRKR
ncbi:MAG: DNA-binding protein [Tannerellaceae bacterium]|nr:DNA-binding protein [Tannerellaceae bacterium]